MSILADKLPDSDLDLPEYIKHLQNRFTVFVGGHDPNVEGKYIIGVWKKENGVHLSTGLYFQEDDNIIKIHRDVISRFLNQYDLPEQDTIKLAEAYVSLNQVLRILEGSQETLIDEDVI